MRQWRQQAQDGWMLQAWLRWACVITGWALFALGSFVGWLAPHLQINIAPFTPADASIPGSLDISNYLGAYITAVSLLVAVVTGSNATSLQEAAQSRSLSLARRLFFALLPFLLFCTATIAVALIYYITSPAYMGQLWQLVFWFAAVVLFVIDYLWIAPSRLSALRLGSWIVSHLKRLPLSRWQDLNEYSTLQVLVSESSQRGDVGAIRALSDELGEFLAQYVDSQAVADNTYNRVRYRTLKDLLSGSSQYIAQAPNAVAYHVGYVAAGVMLQAVATGHPMDDDEHDLFSGLFRNVRAVPDRVNALWTGMRHALCRPRGRSAPFLIIYWRIHARWAAEDPRLAERIAVGLGRFYRHSLRALEGDEAPQTAYVEASEMLIDFYRDIAAHLVPEVEKVSGRDRRDALMTRCLALLDATHRESIQFWPETVPIQRARIVDAYDKRHAELAALLTQAR